MDVLVLYQNNVSIFFYGFIVLCDLITTSNLSLSVWSILRVRAGEPTI